MPRALAWRKSSYSGGANTDCVEIASTGSRMAVRDSKNPTGPVIAFPVVKWQAFVAARRA
ncbi:DUF397 domain-containing protein [Actinosynnema sp. NPDC047251]|uniref:DUF397 domain-containing protein n=1 Tax=Saccharothrix espanaensis (strain ATCC 51144 / DSM 44229 / JCM 9112 / NBRC 15066 / NRRL 15764) TaxID=1179773 RepID=K0K650_SACES|nr:DUF397 domain-containing protein [Saccharothrix espanaensis]CCH35745.1 hypothetical protein BN6_85310 [Saccharothrix espanaensis DSM 44229]